VILARVRIASFAGLADRSVELAPGLNVLEGPNEAGKSTLFRAVQHALFTPAALPRRRLETELGPLFPAGGGDSIGCELEFRHDGRPYRLRKRWGANPEAELVLPEGSRLGAEEAIREALAACLPAGEATVRAVFLAGQSARPRTLEELRKEPAAVGSLQDLLRRAVLQPDELSISAFRGMLEQRLREHLGRWALERERPEDNRGADNPWKQGVGQVLKAWYEWKTLQRQRAAAEEAEDLYSRCGRELQEASARLEVLKRRIEEEEPAARAVWQGRALRGELQGLGEELKLLRLAYDRWPELERSLAAAAAELPAAEERLAALRRERQSAEERERRREEISRLERAREARQAAGEARARLDRLPALTKEELRRLEDAESEVRRLAAVLQASGEAAGVVVSLQTQAALTIRLQRDEEEAQERTVGPGETLSLQARQRARLTAPDWSLEARSDPPGRTRHLEEAEEARRLLASLLAKHGLSSVEAARQACSDCERARDEVGRTEEALRRALGERSWEELERAAAGPPGGEVPGADAPEPRDRAVVAEELARTEAELKERRPRTHEGQKALEALRKEHGDREALMPNIVARTAELQVKERELAALPAPPSGAEDPEAFLARHEQDKRAREELSRAVAELDRQFTRAEENLPRVSAEELAGLEAEAGQRHREALDRARALLEVRAACDAVLSPADDNLLAGFERALGEYAGELTAGRYGSMPLEDALPSSLVRRDGLSLSFEQLSGGTRGLFALALRLAMADVFLGAGEGFLLLDDPLVDLDPDRQERAAGVLSRFASRPGRQVVLLTCHPSHAARFPAAVRVQLFSS